LKLLHFRKDRRNEFEQVALPHLDALYRTAHWMLSDPAAAEDAVQETYMKAWKAFGSFEPGTNVRAWLFTIMTNCVHDIRARRSRDRIAPDGEEILQRQDAKPTPTQTITDVGLEKALAAIPDERRHVVWLADVEGLTYLEVSKALDVPIGTVMSRLSRGRHQLKELLEAAPARPVGCVGKDQTA
jgi:RNA polymerase sigma-70 factor (ECF subfamily)